MRFAAFWGLIAASGVTFVHADSVVLTNLAAEVDRRLALKPHVVKERQLQFKYYDCTWVGRGADRHEACIERIGHQTETYTAPLFTSSAYVDKVNELVASELQTIRLPDKVYLRSLTAFNCSSTQSQVQQSLTLTTTNVVSTSTTKGISSTQALTASVSYKLPTGFGSSLGGSISETVSLSSTETQSKSNTITQVSTITVNVPPFTELMADMAVVEASVRVPFQGTILVEGSVDANKNGYLRISDMLKESKEREISVEGFLGVTAASDFTIGQRDRQLSKEDCKARPERGHSVSDQREFAAGARSSLLTNKTPRSSMLASKSPEVWQPSSIPLILSPQAPRTSKRMLRGAIVGKQGYLCYVAMCNDPPDGYRQVCYYDDETGCTDCADEYDHVCLPPEVPSKSSTHRK